MPSWKAYRLYVDQLMRVASLPPADNQRLREIFRELIAQGAHNIDLITASHFVPFLLPALEEPLPVPVVFNCGGYERVETLRLLEGKVQIWLPDLKYGLEEPARR